MFRIIELEAGRLIDGYGTAACGWIGLLACM
jgi:hypothetical protein